MTTLVGRRLALRPLQTTDAAGLARASADGDVWRTTCTIVPRPQDVGAYVEAALQRQAAGEELPFAMQILATGELVGTTRFRDADPVRRGIEISHTWIARSHQGTGVNAESKLLMLRFAFDTLACIRVQFRCDVDNAVSRNALARIGAKPEGVIRNERVMPDGRKRHAVLFSIVDDEWPEVRERLEARLSA